MIIGTFNGTNIVNLPSNLIGVTGPSSIEWNPQEAVAANVSPFTGQTQAYDWQASWWEGVVSFPSMNRLSIDAWAAFILQCRGQSNAFLFGDPKATKPKGTAYGYPLPVVDGSGQTGYKLSVRGWGAASFGTLLPGDYISAGYRMYRILDQVDVNAGKATMSIWPNLRESPVDGSSISTSNCQGLFRLKSNSGNKYSTNPGTTGVFGLSALAIREAF